jgi:hypothetical protein
VTAHWKCGSSLALRLAAPDEPWDPAAAAASVFELCGFGGRDPDVEFARKAFLAYDANRLEDRAAYLLPFAKAVRGDLVAVPAGLGQVGRLLARASVPRDVRMKAQLVITNYRDDPAHPATMAGARGW